ncbi:MAG: hypothetical protein MAG715_00621 [Methanonatronarchaeales archaeon]|nr:hypothetical protein [Methanonatronarchaeales archaeon]
MSRINLFLIGGRWLFKHYLRDEVFEELSHYYVRSRYRFEVPEQELAEVRDLLEREGYEPVLIRDPEPFSVTKPAYTEMKEIVKKSVHKEPRGNLVLFVMKDEASVEQAEYLGAKRVSEKEETGNL